MIAGVCGGVAEYFDIDPTLVRIIALVLVVVGVGIPIIIYIAAIIIMPPDPAIKQGYVDAQAKSKPAPCEAPFAYQPEQATNVDAEQTGASATAATAARAAASEAAFYSGVTPPPPDQPAAPNPADRVTGAVSGVVKQHWSGAIVVGALLVGAGVIALLANFIHISIWRFWPILLIIAGLIQLFTPSSKGWSLERAGSAISLITVGLVLLAWMLQVIQGDAFVLCLFNLWPVLLVVVGLSIIGGAKKVSAINLAGSLLFSATLILGLWFYSGVEEPVSITTTNGQSITIEIPDYPKPWQRFYD